MPELNARERFHAVTHFTPGVRTLLWEFAYWAATVDRWYGEGLGRSPYAITPGLPDGTMVHAEVVPYPPPPGVSRCRDLDIHRGLGFDEGTVRIPLQWRFCPQLHETVIEEDATTVVLINGDGTRVRQRKDRHSAPQYLAGPVCDRASWAQVKAEHFGPDVLARFPAGWEALAPTYRARDYPLGLMMDGFFSIPRELLGVETHLMMYHDDPCLMHDMAEHLCALWLAMLEEVVAKTDLDFVFLWEDMAYKNGPLISPRMFDEFIAPYYRQITGYLRAHGVDVICVDTDGNCASLIPGFIRAGVSGLYPFEAQAGMDIVAVRKTFPELLIFGGLDKMKIALGPEAIDAELKAKLEPLLPLGGFVPCCDHLVPPDVSWQNFHYYRSSIRDYVGR
jgi:uroporphyrinogen decarboxylase